MLAKFNNTIFLLKRVQKSRSELKKKLKEFCSNDILCYYAGGGGTQPKNDNCCASFIFMVPCIADLY